MDQITTIAKTAQTYAKDLAERVVWTGLAAGGAVALAAGPADMFSASFWETVGAASLAAMGSLLKGMAARAIGDRNSASTAKGV